MGRFLDGVRHRMGEPVDAASLAALRFILGLMMFGGVVRFYAYGWVAQLYTQPPFHFTYWGLRFVEPLPPPWIHVHLGLLALCALCVALGAFFRVSSVGFALLFAWLEFSDKATYLNHYYLVTLLSVAFIFLPMARGYSVDAWRRGSWSATVPAWTVWFFRLQLSVVYFCAGVAKLNPDWLFRAQPLRLWLGNMQDVFLVGGLLSQPVTAYLMSWAGCVFDLAAGFVMLMPRWRRWYYVPIVAFHVVTGVLFNIGLFPWIMIGLTLIYFEPTWPLRFIPGRPSTENAHFEVKRGTLAVLGAYALFQIVMPFRHVLYDGNVLWHEQGFRFSWKVMLVEKAGDVEFRVVEPSTGKRMIAYPKDYFSTLQVKSMSTQPDMILEAAHIVAKDFTNRGFKDVQVFVDAFVAFNGRPVKRLIAPDVDLAREEDSLWGKAWILE